MHVIGTTGLEAAHIAKIEAAARHAVIVRAGNMSLGVNLLVRMTQKIAAALDADWDIEVVETIKRGETVYGRGGAAALAVRRRLLQCGVAG